MSDLRAQGRAWSAAPLGLLAAASALVALAIDVGYGGAVGMTLHAALGFFLSFLALAKAVYATPFRSAMAERVGQGGAVGCLAGLGIAEFALGLLYFSFIWPVRTYTATLALGVLILLCVLATSKRAQPASCGVFNAPIGAVLAVEGVVMIGVSTALLIL